MSEIIGVRFKEGGKIYYFRPNDEELNTGCYVVVETVRGVECGEVVMGRHQIDDGEFNREVKTIIRKATDADLAKLKENKIKAKKAFEICNQKIKAHGLEMNLLEVECTFDNSKMVFNFSAEGRVDFRELVKDLASVFRSRIELRQIGVRDEAKMLGGLGVCGRPFCCKQFMGDFQSVSIKMAKEQGLSLNPVKISGTCGRLMCCLKHEQDAYEDLMRTLPQIGSHVVTTDGPGVVVDRELVAGRVKVRLDGTTDTPPKNYKVADLLKPGENHPQSHHASEKHPSESFRGSRADGKKKPESDAAPSVRPDSKKRPVQDFAESVKADGKKNAVPDFAESVKADGKKNAVPDFAESVKTDGKKRPVVDFTESIKADGRRKPSPETREQKKTDAVAKAGFDYKSVDFEESLSGTAVTSKKINPDDYEEDIRPSRGGGKENYRRSGRRPDRRNSGSRKPGGKPHDERTEAQDSQEEKPSRAGNPNAGGQKPHHGKGKPHYGKKNGAKPSSGGNAPGGSGGESDS